MEKITVYFDQNKGELYFHGMNSEMGTRHFDAFAQREIEKILGPTTKTIMYNAYKKSTLDRFNIFYQEVKAKEPNLSKKDIILRLFDVLSKTGSGILELEIFNEPGLFFQVKVKNCFNVLGYKLRKKPVCYMMSGKLAGLFSLVYGKDMKCKETKCFSSGSKSCEFEIKVSGEKIERPKISENSYHFQNFKKMKHFHLEYNEKKGEIFYNKVSSLIRGRAEVATLQKEFEKIIGPATKTVLYKVCKYEASHYLSKGRSLLVKILRPISKKFLYLKLLEEMYHRGYGVPELVSIDDKKSTLCMRVKNCYNAIGYKNFKKPICHQLSGIIAGASKVIFNKDVDCVERKCIGAGDNYCEFEVRPRE
jgi:hypothetical protein